MTPAPRRLATSIALVLAPLVVLAAAGPRAAQAGEYRLFDDRAAFEAALSHNTDSTVIDSGGVFAPDPAASTGNASVTRSGTIDTDAFAYTLYDLQLAATPTGALVPGTVGGDVGALSGLDVETPASQAGVTGTGSWGLDSSAVSTSRRSGLLADFTLTPGGAGVGHFGADLIDFESDPGTPGELRLYAAGALIWSTPFDFGAGGSDGNVVFLGVVADSPSARFDQIAIVTGGTSDRWAADRLAFGSATNPEPATWALFGLGIAVLGGFVRRRRCTMRA